MGVTEVFNQLEARVWYRSIYTNQCECI